MIPYTVHTESPSLRILKLFSRIFEENNLIKRYFHYLCSSDEFEYFACLIKEIIYNQAPGTRHLIFNFLSTLRIIFFNPSDILLIQIDIT